MRYGSLTREIKPPNAKFLIDGPEHALQTIVLAHGAGAGMDSEFMQAMVEDLACCGLKVVRFEFPYMVKRRETSTRGHPTGNRSCVKHGLKLSNRSKPTN